MTARTVPAQIGGVDVLIEVVPLAGTEPTSGLDTAGERVLDAFERAKAVIMGMASSTVDVIHGMAQSKVARPDRVEVEFGLGFSVKGNIVVAGASADASLKVKLCYDIPAPDPSLPVE